MKTGRRSKHSSIKTWLSRPLLSRLNSRERQELEAKSGAVKAPVKPRRPTFGLEAVEPRLLMSADLSYATMNDTLTLSVIGTSGAPSVKLADASGQLASAPLLVNTDTQVNVHNTSVLPSADTLNIDLTNFATLNTFVAGHGGALTINFDGGSEFAGTPVAKIDLVNVNGTSGALNFGLTIQSTSVIDSSANLTARSLTLTSAQTASDLLTTGLFANANTGINLTGASLTTTAGALNLNANSTLSVSTDGTGMSAVKGAVITSFSNAGINIGGSSVLHATGGDLDITANVNGTLAATADGATVKLIAVAGSATPEVTINGSSVVSSTTGAVNAVASTNVTITAKATPASSATDSKVDAAVLNTTYGSGAAMTVNGGASVIAKQAATLSAASTLSSSTVADASVGSTAGASVAVSVITGDTTASVANASVSGSAVNVTASSNRTVTTTALSSKGGSSASGSGSNTSEKTLASNNASTGTGQNITVAGAIAVSTDTGSTSAFLGGGAVINAGTTGAATVSASSVDVVALTADGEFTQSGTTGVGVAVAIGVDDRTDSAYVTGSVNVTAGTLDVAVLAPAPSTFTVSATSGVGNSSSVGFAGSLAINVGVLDHEAYLDQNASLNLTGHTNTTFESHSNVANSVKALPIANGGSSAGVGIGASVAIDYGQDQTQATIDNGATLIGANNLTLTAIGAHTMLTDATAGGAGATGITPVVAISVANDINAATLGTGTLLTLGGALVASSTLSNAVSTNAVGDTKSGKTGVGISFALSVVNDSSTATTARDITAAGAMSFLSTMNSGSATSAAASVMGGQQDDGSGTQSADKTTGSQEGFANSTAQQKDAKAKGTQGATAPSASTSDGSVSVAGAIAVNIEQATSQADIADGRSIAAGGTLAVKSAAHVDGSANATGSAVTNSTTIDPTKVDFNAGTIDLGTSSTLKTGDGVTYYAGQGGPGIGGLTNGTKYYVDVVSGGHIKLYDNATDAKAAGTTGLIKLTSTGSAGEYFSGGGSTGTSVGVAVSVNFVKDTNLAYLGGSTFHVGGLDVEATTAPQTYAFNPASAVNTTKNTINLGVTDLATGDAVTYNTNGGTPVTGLTNGTVYYVNVQADGSVELYDTSADAVAGGATGLTKLTGTGSGNATLVSNPDVFAASAVSGAGGGKTGVAGSVAINIDVTDTEADLGYTQPSSPPGVPAITVTGSGNVTLNAQTAETVTASATPANGGGTGKDLGVGISVSVDYAQTSTLAQIANGAVLTGANNLTLTAASKQTMTTTTQGGASGSTGVTPIISIAITDNDTKATLGSGATISLTGAFSATASLTDKVEDSATGATQSDGTGVGISVAVTVVNDHALATTGRNLTSTAALPANGAITFSATNLSTSQSVAVASVAGGQQDDGSGNHNDGNSNSQTVDNTTKKQTGFGDSEVSGADSSAKGSEGSNSNNKAQSSNGSVSVAGAVSVNVESATAIASIPDGITITAPGVLSVTTLAQVDGQAFANGAATTSSGGTGVGIGVAVNVVNATNQATIGNGTVITAGGVIVGANMAQRPVTLKTTSVAVVDTTKNSIFLGLGTGLTTGTGVKYDAEGNTAIAGLTDGTTYYVNSKGDGTFTLYDTAAHATAGGSTGLLKLTGTTGAGTEQQFVQQLFGVIPTGNIKFNPTGNVTLLNLGKASDLHTGDVVTYNNGGGTNMGGLTNGSQYYVIDLTGGNYQLATTLDNAQNGIAIALGAAGSSTTQTLVDTTDNSRTEAMSGAGGGKIGVAVSVGVNVVSNTTLASIGDTAALTAPKVTITGAGTVSVTATSNEGNFARALPSNGSTTGGSSVGVGGSVGVNVVTNHTNATIIDGTSWAGSAGAVTVSATSVDTAVTHGENGASGGGVSVGIGAAVEVVQDTTAAYVGTGSQISATGAVSITASHTGTFETTTNASAAGSSVAVGASVSVGVVQENVSAQVARSIVTTGGAVSVMSTSTVTDQTLAVASSSGESSSDSQQNSNGKTGADGQADKQVNGNSNTGGSSLPSASSDTSGANSQSSSQGGGDSGGVGVAASVSVGVLTLNNNATVTNGAALSATGAVTIQAQAGIDDKTLAVGSSVSIQSGSTEVGAGVSVAVVNTTNDAEVGNGSAIAGNGITIAAVTPAGKTDNFVVWGAAAAGGTGDASIAGSVAINVVNSDNNQASTGAGSSLKSSGAINVQATNAVNMQTLAAAGALSEGTSIGAAIDVATLNVNSVAFIGGNADAAGALSVDANITLAPTQIALPKVPSALLPTATSIAVAGAAGTGSAAVAGSVIVDVFTLHADSYIGANSLIDKGGFYAATAGQTVSVTAENTTTITGIAGALGATTGGAGIGASLDLEVISKQTYAYIDQGAQVAAGGGVTINAMSSEHMLSVTATLGGGDSAGIAATASIAPISTDTEAYVGANAHVTAGGFLTVEATSTFFTTMIAGTVGVGGTAGVGAGNSTLVHSATTKALIGAADVISASTVLVIASASEDVLAIVAGIAVGGTAGVAGSATVNVLTERTTASVGAGSNLTVTGAGSLIVAASDTTSVISVAGDLAVGGSAGVGVGVDVGVYDKKTNAYIDSGVVATVGGSVEVIAQSTENLISVAAGIAVSGTAAIGVNAGVHVFTLQTRAFIGDDPNAPSGKGPGNVHAAGSVVISANDVSDINEIVGVLAAGQVGVAAGAGVNVFTKDTEAFIGAGAAVTGLGNGATVTVDTGRIDNSIGASTSTFSPNSPSGQGIDSSSSSTLTNAANGNHAAFASSGQIGTPQIAGMDLTGNGSSQSINNPSLSGNRTTSVDTQTGFSGVAVAATNQDEIRTFTVTFGAGEVGIGVSAGVDVVKANTQAYIGVGAAVNASLAGANANQSVLVGAGDDFYHLAVGVGVGVGAVGIAPSVGVNIITDTTNAAINAGATVNALNSIAVEATGGENVVLIGIGAAAGAVGVGAVVDVLSISNMTTASIGASASVHAGGNVFVSAIDNTSVLELSGALAGGLVGVGGSVGVMLISKTTDATIGASANVSGLGNSATISAVLDGGISGGTSFTTTSVNGVIVQAQSTETMTHIVAAGGVGYVGVSGAVGLSFLNITTDATIGANAIINSANPFASSNQSVYVTASDNVNFSAYVIGVAGGFVGVTGAVDVGTLSDNIAAVVQSGAQVRGRNAVEIISVGIQSLTGYVISGAGGAVAAGASVMDWSIGQALQTNYSNNNGQSASAVTNGAGNPDSNAADQSQTGTSLITGSNGIGGLNSSGASANSNAGRINSATGNASGMVNSAAPTSASIMAMQGATPVAPGTSAVVQGGAQITAGNNITVFANESATVKEFLGQVAGGVVGLGASVDILSVANNVQASDDGNNSSGGNVSVLAALTSNMNLTVLDLAAGFVGLGAGVAVATDDSTVQATLGSVSSAGFVTVLAESLRTDNILSGQASIGAVGAGATFTKLTVDGSTSATVDPNAVIGTAGTPVGGLTDLAYGSVTATVETDAVTAGIGSFGANFSILNVDPAVTAGIGTNASVHASGSVRVEALSVIDAQGKTFGVAAGGLSVGVSLTTVTVAPTVTADAGAGDVVTAGALTIMAETMLPGSGYDAQANATGSAGALIGITSTNTQASNNDTVAAFIGNAANIAVVGAITISALNNTGQKSTADSNAGGLIAAGLASSSATSNTSTSAYLGNTVQVHAADLSIEATGLDNNFAYTNAGSGGLVAGSSAQTGTTNDSTTTASIGSSDSIFLLDQTVGLTNGFILAAAHTATFNAQISTFAGGLFAGAGGSLNNEVTANTTASIGSSALVSAYDINVTSVNIANKPPLGTQNIYGTTGGLVSGAGASDTTTINFTTLVNVGSGAFLNARGVQSNAPILTLAASNSFLVNDIVTFETGGALSGAFVGATINVPTDIAQVEVGSGAVLLSQGQMLITARGGGSFDEEVQTDTFGLGTVSIGTTTVNVNATNQVLIDASSMLTAYGDLNISTGADAYPNYDQYTVTARYDSYAGSLVPISDVNANATLIQNNIITIAGLAQLKTAQQANLDAQKYATANMKAYAEGVSWASDVADAILKALGGGGAIVHGGNSHTGTYSTITNNGTIQTGINSHLTLTLMNNPSYVAGQPVSQAVIAAPGSSPTITFTVSTQTPVSPLVAELAYDQSQLALYGATNPTLNAYYTGEIARITAVLQSQGLLTNEPGGLQSANPQPVLTVTINPIYAEAGEIDVHANQLGGTGTFIAPNSATVTITNNSAASLNLLGIDIPAAQGGLWYDIGLVNTNAQIATIDSNNQASDHNNPPDTLGNPQFNLSNVAGGPAAVPPAISVVNTFNIKPYNVAHPDAPLQWPAITLLSLNDGGIGITNPNGSLLLENDSPSQGAITLDGPVNVGTQTIITGGTLTITGVSVEEVAGLPYQMWNAITQGAYAGGSGAQTGGVGPASPSAIANLLSTTPPGGLMGSSITINADYIDINGKIQAGVSTYSLTIDSTVTAEIQNLLSQGYTGLLYLANESQGNFTVEYNTQTNQILVGSDPINGGYVNLTGHVVDTGHGEIDVFGGYGTINVTNNTNFDVVVQNLDASSAGQGQLIINDLAKNSLSKSTFTEYQYVPGASSIDVTTDPGTGPVSSVVAGPSTVYTPASGWRYGWTINDNQSVVLQEQTVSSNWLGLIPTGSSFFANATTISSGTPTISPTGPYFYYDPTFLNTSAPGFDLQQSSNTVTTHTGPIITVNHTEVSHWYGGHTYSALFQEINGAETFYQNDISASRNIAINFTGGSLGQISVIANGTGNVILGANVLDPNGIDNIAAYGGSILSTGASQILTGTGIYLYAANGIGTTAAPINVVLNGDNVGVTASAAAGDVNITAVSGDLPVGSIQSGVPSATNNKGLINSAGAINLIAAQSITVAGAPLPNVPAAAGIALATSYAGGTLQGGPVTLTAMGGFIGNSILYPLRLNTLHPVAGNVDTLTATAITNVFLEQLTGDMLLNSITTGGNVWIDVPSGSLLNANSSSTTDTRTQAQLAAGVWTDLGLTATTGYQQKINNTLASFVGQQDAQYQTYWNDLNSGNTSGPGFLALKAIYGAGGTYAAQNPGYNPKVYNGSAAVIPAPVFFTGNSVSSAVYFTAASAVYTPKVYFTAGPVGRITRTDGGNWLTDGFAAGQAITVTGSALDSTGAQSFTISSVTASVITLSVGDPIKTEGSASAAETISIQRNATITVPGAGNWVASGFAVGQTITVSGSASNNKTFTITGLSAKVIALSPADVVVTEATALLPRTVTVTNNKAATITRTDGGSWIASGFAVGQSISVGGSPHNTTGAGKTYTITGLTAATITLSTQNQIVSEGSSSLPENVTLQHTTSDTPDPVKAYFTGLSGSTPGSITRTDGGNWLTDGFAVGQTILVTGSTSNNTVGATSYTVTGVTATVLTLSVGDAVVTEGTAAAPKAITVQHIFSYKMTAAQISTLTSGIRLWTPNQLLTLFGAGLLKNVTDTVITVGAPNIIGTGVTILTGGAVGSSTGGTITIPLSYPPNPPTVLTTAQQAALAAAERVDVQYLAAAPISGLLNFDAVANTITLTNGDNWGPITVGEYITVQGANGVYTQNETDGAKFYKVIGVNGTLLTIDPTTPLVATEVGISATVAPVVLDPTFQATAPAQSANVYFTPATATTPGTITRTDGISWIAKGFKVGQLLEIQGSLNNSTSPDVPDVITAVTATTITLASNDFIVAEATSAAAETISLIQGISPQPVAIVIHQIKPINVNATGLVSITAVNNVYLDSAVDVRLNQVVAGTALIGSQIEIKAQGSILNDAPATATGAPAVNLQGGNIILEASGANADPGTIGFKNADLNKPIVIGSIGNGTVTARAKGLVDISDVAVLKSIGNLNLETVYSATGDAILSAQGSILAALDNGFTTIQANNIILTAFGTIGGIVNGGINYIYLDNAGTVTATAYRSIWLSEGDLSLSYKLNLDINQIISSTGDVTLRSGLSMLDSNSASGALQIEGNNITLMALSGAIGTAANPLDIFGALGTTLTASAGLGDIHISNLSGNLTLHTVTDTGGSVYLTSVSGAILNGGLASTINIQATNAWLMADTYIGASTTRITTQVAALEAQSVLNDTYINNSGALKIGGTFIADALGVTAGGSAIVTSSSPVTIAKSIYAGANLLIIAQNGPLGSLTDGPGNLTVNGLDTLNNPLMIEAGAAVLLYAGDNLAVQPKASIKAGLGIALVSDYQGDLNGVTPAAPPPSRFVTTGTAIQVQGTLAAPIIYMIGGDGPDTITTATTAVLTAAYPWTAATYPPQLGTFPAAPSTASIIRVDGGAGNDRITLNGSIVAQNINIIGGDGSNTISLLPVNAMTGIDVIFGNKGVVTYASGVTGPVTSIVSSDSAGAGNDTITVGNAVDAIVFGGQGSNRITLGNGDGTVFGNDGAMSFTLQGTVSVLTSARTINPGIGGADTITVGNGNFQVFGGVGANTIRTGAGNDIVFGHDGGINYDPVSGLITSLASANPTDSGATNITVGNGNNIVIGGIGNGNSITAGNGNDVVIGQDGALSFTAGQIAVAASTDPTFGGGATIKVGSGDNVIIGGTGNNTITAGAAVAPGYQVIVGHNGTVKYAAPNVLASVQAQDVITVGGTVVVNGGTNTVTAGNGNNLIVGGVGKETITTGNGNDVVIGHDGLLTFNTGTVTYAASMDPGYAGDATIKLGIGNNIAIGGSGNNTITAVSGNQIILGDNGFVKYSAPGVLSAIASQDVVTTGTTTVSYGGNNTITVGNGNDMIIGGVGADTIKAGNGNSVIIGDEGQMLFNAAGQMTTAQTLNDTFGGADTITAGIGKDVVFGGAGNDTITLGASTTYVVLGGGGIVTFNPGAGAHTASVTTPASTGTDTITIGANPPVVLSGVADIVVSGLLPQFAAATAPAGYQAGPALTEAALQPIVVEAEEIWARVLGPDNARLAILNGITVDIGHLSNGLIGETTGDLITIDATADGWGWFTDTSVAGNSAFQATPILGVLRAASGSAAAGHMDLLSTVLHELGNAMGFPEDSGQDVTGNVLAAGTRRLPVLQGAVGAASGVPTIDWGTANTAEAAALTNPGPDASSWVDGFLTNLGQPDDGKGPNAGMRIKPQTG